MKKLILAVSLCLPLLLQAEPTPKRLNSAAAVLGEIMSTPDKGIPLDLMHHAQCIVVIPGVKQGAFGIGAKYGKGFFSCRRGADWSAPGSIRVEGGSVGFQIGANETDVILLIMNRRGAERLLSTQFTIGGAAEAAAGPVGRRFHCPNRHQPPCGNALLVAIARSLRRRFSARRYATARCERQRRYLRPQAYQQTSDQRPHPVAQGRKRISQFASQIRRARSEAPSTQAQIRKSLRVIASDIARPTPPGLRLLVVNIQRFFLVEPHYC